MPKNPPTSRGYYCHNIAYSHYPVSHEIHTSSIKIIIPKTPSHISFQLFFEISYKFHTNFTQIFTNITYTLTISTHPPSHPPTPPPSHLSHPSCPTNHDFPGVFFFFSHLIFYRAMKKNFFTTSFISP